MNLHVHRPPLSKLILLVCCSLSVAVLRFALHLGGSSTLFSTLAASDAETGLGKVSKEESTILRTGVRRPALAALPTNPVPRPEPTAGAGRTRPGEAPNRKMVAEGSLRDRSFADYFAFVTQQNPGDCQIFFESSASSSSVSNLGQQLETVLQSCDLNCQSAYFLFQRARNILVLCSTNMFVRDCIDSFWFRNFFYENLDLLKCLTNAYAVDVRSKAICKLQQRFDFCERIIGSLHQQFPAARLKRLTTLQLKMLILDMRRFVVPGADLHDQRPLFPGKNLPNPAESAVLQSNTQSLQSAQSAQSAPEPKPLESRPNKILTISDLQTFELSDIFSDDFEIFEHSSQEQHVVEQPAADTNDWHCPVSQPVCILSSQPEQAACETISQSEISAVEDSESSQILQSESCVLDRKQLQAVCQQTQCTPQPAVCESKQQLSCVSAEFLFSAALFCFSVTFAHFGLEFYAIFVSIMLWILSSDSRICQSGRKSLQSVSHFPTLLIWSKTSIHSQGWVQSSTSLTRKSPLNKFHRTQKNMNFIQNQVFDTGWMGQLRRM